MAVTGEQAGKYILLGKVTKPHGIRGEVKVYPYSGSPGNFTGYQSLLLAPVGDAAREPYTIVQARVQGKMAILKLKECVTRSEAEALVNQEVWMHSSELPKLESEDVYLHQLEGMTAVTESGEQLGRVAAIVNTGGHDILAVREGKREYLIPFVKEFIVRLEEDQVVLSLPPGLLEINQ